MFIGIQTSSTNKLVLLLFFRSSKDLHRTGCGWFFEHDTAEDRASLKRVLLAYARWNKQIGYCQGFNVIAALILQVMEGNEEHALKVRPYFSLFGETVEDLFRTILPIPLS